MTDEKKNVSKTKPTNWSVYLRIIKYIRKYLSFVFIGVGLSFIISILHFASLGLIKPLGDLLFSNNSDFLLKQIEKFGEIGKFISMFFKYFITPYKMEFLYFVLVIILFISAIKNLLRFFQEYLSGYVTAKVGIDISNELFSKVGKLPIKYFSFEGASQISARFVNDIPMMERGLKDVFSKAIREPLKAVATLILAFMINWRLALITCLLFPIAAIFLKKLGQKVKRGARKILKKQASIMAILQETFMGAKIVKAYCMEEQVQQRFEGENKKLFKSHLIVIAADAATNPLMETFVIFAGAFVLVL